MASHKTSYKYLLLLGLSLILTTCSVEKNTDTTRFYHSMTARYNIYFNGYESFKAGLLKLTNGYQDDYAEMLKVFEYSDPSTVSLCSSDMERAIQKASKLISLKSITAKPEIKDKEPAIRKRERTYLTRKNIMNGLMTVICLLAKPVSINMNLVKQLQFSIIALLRQTTLKLKQKLQSGLQEFIMKQETIMNH